ncbi:hypothetical protein K469DRAFT_700225 [Zopfia rhizophila CBS 207.26]|uniref:WSC domain-containing protein n=1 Tax=Zopfia rhizophila CBS 207.26 TaxID=1314779 RepID=A0A6A6DA11_9PEZI|nr:hypothetical protein K469DRAFT_700225 [Zopfia rhizophila CBS 207.26]
MIYPSLALLGLLFVRAGAVEVTADSPCSNVCINRPGLNVSDIGSSQTFSGDLSCLDSDYNGDDSTAIGRKFRSCVSCEQTSEAVDRVENENDVYWFLFNLKSTVVWCVHGFFEAEQNPNSTLANSDCNSACDPIGTALLDRLKQTNQSLQYNYCTSDNSAFTKGVNKCTDCLYGVDNLKILGNFLTALKAACDQKPPVGETISLKSNVFSAPTPTPSSLSSLSVSASVSASVSKTAESTNPVVNPTSSNLPNNLSSPSSSLSGGAIAGIAIGAVAGIALIGAGIFILLRRRERGADKGIELDGNHVHTAGVGAQEYRQALGAKGQAAEIYGYSQPAEMPATRAPVELPGGLQSPGMPK